MGEQIVVEGLAEFRADLRRALDAAPREMTKALKLAGVPVVRRAGELAAVGTARSTGELSKSYGTSVRGTVGQIVSRAAYGPGAEWGVHGKWKGFIHYGARGARFAGRALDEKADEVMELVYAGLREVLEFYGWATP